MGSWPTSPAWSRTRWRSRDSRSGKIVLRPENIDLRDVVQRAIELSQAAIDAQGIELEVTCPPEPVPTCADPVRLAQVTSNLIINAAKFSNWGGRVAVGLETSEHQAVITVRDWGRGIPPPDLERIFEPFVQSEASDTWRGGLGIGLALVKKLVALHGGSVRADKCGERTRSRIRRDAAAHRGGRRGRATPRWRVAPEIQRHRPACWSSTTTPRCATPSQLFLQLAGHSVTTADSGSAALVEIARTDPDVVLLDIDLPDLDGYTVAKQVRASRTDCAATPGGDDRNRWAPATGTGRCKSGSTPTSPSRSTDARWFAS